MQSRKWIGDGREHKLLFFGTVAATKNLLLQGFAVNVWAVTLSSVHQNYGKSLGVGIYETIHRTFRIAIGTTAR